MGRFRKFVEDLEAPAMNPETHDDSRVIGKEFDISKDDQDIADMATPYTLSAPLTLPNGVKVFAGTQISIEPMDNGNYKIHVLATNSQKMRDMDNNDWHGDLKQQDTEMIVSKDWVETNLKSPALKSMGGGVPPAPGGMF